ncbi:hypothetical protein CVT25_011276 [Psilocybe cyanescens]|uniref:Peptidase C14 caspase domain-containing protein n=1 Tax=Psilocybe cyanescens TaxID=93625 RepID=A0A409XCK4_PSICY|nr:hypothetical protein CVT25_011276 [Psilocybe cyanescens]
MSMNCSTIYETYFRKNGIGTADKIRTSLPPSGSLFALIIGINEYLDPEVSNLPGAFNDAEDVQNFLISKLGVPKERIVNLRDKQATREAIISAIQGLAANPAIGPNDPILVYYAGHGAEARSPLDESSLMMIQMLLPYDFETKGSVGHQGQGLFDVTMSSLLTCVANKKSNNITVVLDSCYSGSGTRDIDSPDEHIVSRRVMLPPGYTISKTIFKADSNVEFIKREKERVADAYEGVFEERASGVPSEYKMHALRSHVLLSACSKTQTAKEVNGHGAFTSALLRLLGKEILEDLSYKDVIQRLGLNKAQDPQCEGLNQNRKIFTSKITGRSRNLYTILGSETPGEYSLQAGEAHGIARNAQFAVFADDRMSLPIGSVVAQKTTAFKTQCAVLDVSETFNLPRSAYAVQTRAGEEKVVRIFIEPKDEFLPLFYQILKETPEDGYRTFHVVNSVDEDPDLILSTSGAFVRFNVTNKICHRHGLTCMPCDGIRIGETERLRSVLRGAAEFYWNLQHKSKNPQNILTNKIHLECFKVMRTYTMDPQAKDILILEPVGDNLNINGTTYIDVGDEAQYGFKIRNHSTLPLYASLFYFDVSDLSIVSYHLPNTAPKGNADFCLPANETLCIGFSDSGSPPFEYFLRDKQEVDIGFLKLYLSPEFVDFSLVEQKTPFEEDQRGCRSFSPEKTQVWDTIIVPIVQRKGKLDTKPLAVNPGFDKTILGDNFVESFSTSSVSLESNISSIV